jgi:hypothetical protein
MSFGVIIIEEKRRFITKKSFVPSTIRPVTSALHANVQSTAPNCWSQRTSCVQCVSQVIKLQFAPRKRQNSGKGYSTDALCYGGTDYNLGPQTGSHDSDIACYLQSLQANAEIVLQTSSNSFKRKERGNTFLRNVLSICQKTV